MAAALIGGLSKVSEKNTLRRIPNLWVYDHNPEKLANLAEHYQVHCAESSTDLIARCTIIVLAVKPQAAKIVVSEIRSLLHDKQPLIISVAAGLKCETIESWIGGAIPIIRVMPNTPALVAKGASGIYANAQASNDQKELTEQIFTTVGLCCWVDKESDIDIVTALSGSGPAYFMLLIQSLIDAASGAGLDPSTARKLAQQTALGSASMIEQSEQSIESLIENITSPNGTTEKAMASFYQAEFPSIVNTAFNAAHLRARQLSIELENHKQS